MMKQRGAQPQQGQQPQQPPMQGGGRPMAQGLGAGMQDQPDEAMGQEGEPATPEEQAQYEKFIDNAMQLIYDEKAMPTVLKSLEGGGDPMAGLANTAATIVLQVETSAEQQGMELAEGVVFNAGVAILEDLANLGSEVGLHDFSEQEIEGALYQALDIYREMKSGLGEIDQDKYAQDLQMLVQADQQGKLGEIVPGAEKAAARAPKPPAGNGAAPKRTPPP